MNTLSVSTKYRDIKIREGELPTITKSDLKNSAYLAKTSLDALQKASN